MKLSTIIETLKEFQTQSPDADLEVMIARDHFEMEDASVIVVGVEYNDLVSPPVILFVKEADTLMDGRAPIYV